MSSHPAVDGDGWPSRIGHPAADLIRRATSWRRAGGIAMLLTAVLEIGFQLDDYYRPGVEGSAVLFPAGMFALFRAIRLMARARKLVSARLGLPPGQAKWVRLRHGEAGYDHWLAARGDPGWPAPTRR